MSKLRQFLLTSIICSIILFTCASAQVSLTQIQDTVYNANGTPFNGTLIITWNGFTSPSGNTIAPHSTSVQIYNGVLSIFLVPSTTASAGAYYTATYNSNDGLTTWAETWQVPPSTTPLTLNQVRQPTSSSSGTGTSTGTGTGTGTETGITLPIAITDVSGLSAALNTLTTSLSSLTATVNSLSSGSTSASFVDDETPGGSSNGTNTVFTLSQTPSPAASLALYRNGDLQAAGVNYTLSGSTITFTTAPNTGDILTAFYRIAGTGPTASFADDETPSGTINGTNATFTLAATPSPALSLKLYKNGLLLQEGGDYTLSGSTITFTTNAIPQTGDSLAAYYRH